MLHMPIENSAKLKAHEVTALAKRPSFALYRDLFKRVLDVTAVVVALPLLAPLFAIIALLIRREGGPAFYGHKRVGRDGEIFVCWKFRSMIVDADEKLQDYLDADPVAAEEWRLTQKLKEDPRITGFGAFLRKSSLDELPQLWNVLKGDMSLVGPRPFMPCQTALYPGQMYYRMRPGLTGIWQVSKRNESSFAARAGYDDAYYRKLSLRMDIGLLFRTIGVVFGGRGY